MAEEYVSSLEKRIKKPTPMQFEEEIERLGGTVVQRRVCALTPRQESMIKAAIKDGTVKSRAAFIRGAIDMRLDYEVTKTRISSEDPDYREREWEGKKEKVAKDKKPYTYERSILDYLEEHIEQSCTT